MDTKTERWGFLTAKFLAEVQREGLAKVSFSDGCGNSATITRDKHGFYKTKVTLVEDNIHE